MNRSIMFQTSTNKHNMDDTSSFWFHDETINEFDKQYSSYIYDEIKTRIVWVTNYTNNEDYSINVPVDDPLRQLITMCPHIIENETLISNKTYDKMPTPDLSKLNLNDLLILLYRLQQKASKTSLRNSTSPTSSSSASSGFIENKSSSQMSTRHPLNSKYSHSSLSIHNEVPSNSYVNHRHYYHHQPPSFTFSNLADVPKQLTTTLAKPLLSSHSSKHIHSPNDVVDKLLQTYNLHTNNYNKNLTEHKLQRYSSRYAYQQAQQHKAKLISNLLSSKSMQQCSSYFH